MNCFRRKLALATLNVIVLGQAGCSSSAPSPPPILDAASAPDRLFIAPGRIEIPLTFLEHRIVSARLSSGATPSIVWESSNPSVFSVRSVDASSVELTGHAGGSATLTAKTADGGLATTEVLVTAAPPTRFSQIAPRSATVDGLTVSAITKADSTPPDAVSGAVRYTTTAMIRNVSSGEREIDVPACGLSVVVNAGGGWYNEEMRYPVWDQLRNGKGCDGEARHVVLPPGATYSLQTSALAHEILTTAAPNYRYFFHAHVRFDETEIVVGGDSATITFPTSGLAASATSTIRLRDTTQMLATSVTLTNNGKLPAHLEYGACAVRVLAFRDEARTGNPVWNSDYRKPYHASSGYGCILVLYVSDLQPSKSADFGFVSPLIELVGDSLPNGRYYLAADLLVSAHPPFTRIPAGSVDVQLAHPRR